jgi:hypothetical protein
LQSSDFVLRLRADEEAKKPARIAIEPTRAKNGVNMLVAQFVRARTLEARKPTK